MIKPHKLVCCCCSGKNILEILVLATQTSHTHIHQYNLQVSALTLLCYRSTFSFLNCYCRGWHPLATRGVVQGWIQTACLEGMACTLIIIKASQQQRSSCSRKYSGPWSLQLVAQQEWSCLHLCLTRSRQHQGCLCTPSKHTNTSVCARGQHTDKHI